MTVHATATDEELRQDVVEILLQSRTSAYVSRAWVTDNERYWANRMARQIVDIARRVRDFGQTELRLQELLLSYGWRNPLRDSARLVDGPLRPLLNGGIR